jgi:hypothetical protein
VVEYEDPDDSDAESTEKKNEAVEKLFASLKKVQKLRSEMSAEEVKAYEEDLKLQERAIAKQEEIIAKEKERSLTIEARAALHDQEIDKVDLELKLLDQRHQAGDLDVQQYQELVRIKEREREVQRQLLVEQKKYAIGVEESVKAATDMATQFGKITSAYGANQVFNYDNIMSFSKALFSGKAGLIGWASELASSGLKNFVNSVINLALELDKAESAFRRSTGASADMAREMTNSYEATRESTVSLQQNQEAWSALYTTYTDFTMISEEARAEIGQTTAILSQLGVSAADSAKGMQVADKMLGQTGTSAAATLRDLSSLAENIGVAPAQLIAQYGQIGPSLSKLGADGSKAFKELARVSKLTGMEMQKLLAVTDKFDTFEGAATSAGKLNAALGGNFVNAMDLMMATDPAERFGMLRGALDEAGLSFDDMSYYQRKFYADSLGLDSVGDLALMMSGNMEALGAETEKTSSDYEEAAARAQEMADVQTQLKTVMQSLIPVVTPLLNLIQTFADFLSRHIDTVKLIVEWVGYAIVVYKGWKVATMLYQKAVVTLNGALALKNALFAKEGKWAALKSLWTKKTIAETELETEKEIQNDAVKKKSIVTDQLAGKTAAKTAPQMLALGVAVLLIGAGIAVAALGMAEFVKAFAGFSAGEILAIAVAIGVLTAGLYFLIPALIGLAAGAPGVAVLLALGAAVLMIGGAIALVAVGVGKMAEGVAVMFTSMDVEKVKAFSLFIATVSLAAIFLFPAAIGMLALGVGLLGVAFALKFIATDDLEAIALFSESLASIQSGQLLETAKAIRQVAKAMDDIPNKKAFTFTTILQRVEASANAISRAGGAQAYGQATGGTRAGGGGGAVTAATASSKQQVTVKLELDGKLLEEKVLNIVDGKFAEAS